MRNIEVELRSFLTQEEYNRLILFFSTNARLIRSDEQETHYLDHSKDIRIQRSKNFAKVWLKKGKIHDEAREEIELKVKPEQFGILQKMFKELDLGTKIVWLRARKVFTWEGVTVMIDDTKGYGKILEIEIITSKDRKDEALSLLHQKFTQLGIQVTPREVFSRRFEDYTQNWRTYLK
jgi:predicted adenylyl cyclase CyaB